MIEVFKTDVQRKRIAKGIMVELLELLPQAKISFDLDDCDKILRIESEQLCVEKIIELVKGRGFSCEVLE